MSELTLWSHQLKAREAFHAAVSGGRPSGLLVMPTGSGKTIAFATCARDLGLPTLVLAHRDELIRQTERAFAAAWPGATVGVIQGQRDGWRDGQQVVIASVQSLHARRLGAMPRDRFGLAVVDEAHHTAADSYAAVLHHFSPRRFLLGVTATPGRLDGVGLHRWYGDSPLYSYSIRDAVNDGVLCKVEQLRIDTGVSLDGVRTYKGDFAEGRLADAVNTPARNRVVVDACLGHAAGRRGVAFCADVRHARDLAGAFQAAGVACACVTGVMAPVERQETLEAFAAGEIDILTCCQVLTEGFDDPGMDLVVMARPTASHTLYVQCVGRGLRRHPGKADCLVLDVADNCTRHKLVTVTDLADAESKTSQAAPGPSPGVGHRRQAPAGPLAPLVWAARSVSPWPELPSLDGYAERHRWQSEPATGRQLEVLAQMHLRPAFPLTKGQASWLIDRAFAMQPATYRQRQALTYRGLWREGMSKREAMALLSS